MVVTVDAADVAHALALEGAAVVILAATAEANARAGVLARQVEGAGGRVGVFTGDAGTDEGRAALAELLDELFG